MEPNVRLIKDTRGFDGEMGRDVEGEEEEAGAAKRRVRMVGRDDVTGHALTSAISA